MLLQSLHRSIIKRLSFVFDFLTLMIRHGCRDASCDCKLQSDVFRLDAETLLIDDLMGLCGTMSKSCL